MFDRYTQLGLRVLQRSHEEAARHNRAFIDTRDLLIALVFEEGPALTGEVSIAARILNEAGLTYDDLCAFEIQGTEGVARSHRSGTFSDQFRGTLMDTIANGYLERRRLIGPEHLLVALLGQRDCFAIDILCAKGLDPTALRATTIAVVDQINAAACHPHH